MLGAWPARAAYEEVSVSAGGVVSGVVRFLGAAQKLEAIAVTPVAVATLLVFVLLPDGFAVMKKTDAGSKPAVAAPAPAKH